MKKALSFITLSLAILTSKADTGQEIYTYFSDSQINTCTDLAVVREIKGGTSIITDFEGDWDEDMKGAFRYACKIWEENLPTMLPIRIKVRIGNFHGRSNSLSKVRTRAFTSNYYYATQPEARYVVLREYNRRHNVAFTTLQDSLEMCNPDIEITYNSALMNTDSLSFSLNAASTTKLDFVTHALRDIATGLGFSTGFVPYANQLELPPRYECLGMEKKVGDAIRMSTPQLTYQKATQGTVNITVSNNYGSLQLYAPSTWVQGRSLNTFIPSNSSGLSQIMTYQYGKGTVIREISDNYDELARELLEWNVNIAVGMSSSSVGYSSCSNEDVVAYHGTLTASVPSYLNGIANGHDFELDEQNPDLVMSVYDEDEAYDIENYCKPFDPTLSMSNNVDYQGWTLAILKTDGTWDVVAQSTLVDFPFSVNLSNITFHYDDEDYARSADNYLRARVSRNIRSTNSLTGYGKNNCTSSYYLLDYKPQRIDANIAELYAGSTYPDEYARDIDIAISNLEGATDVYIEQLEEGDIYPSIRHLLNFKDARFRAVVDVEYGSTFTMVAYNANGNKRSLPLYYVPETPAQLTLTLAGDEIIARYGHKNKKIDQCRFEVYPIMTDRTKSVSGIETPAKMRGENGRINIRALSQGTYIVKATMPNGQSSSIKISR